MGSGGSTASAARQEELNSGQVKLQDWTEQEVVGMLKIFAQIDHDRSGMIERGELEAFMKTQGRHMENFKSLDWNDDGKMDKREFFQWHARRADVTDAWAAAGLGGVVVVASDNGSPHDARGFAGNLPLRGQKHELWEGGVRVPAFVFGAGVPRGAARRNVVAAVDWWPTLVKLAGGSSSEHASLDGVDLWPAVARGDDVRSELLHNFDTSSKPTAGFRGAPRVGDLKLVLLEKHERTFLYNVTADPVEAADLAARRPDDAAALLAKLEAYGAAAAPCWGGTGPTPNPTTFSGDCDAHPARSCESPAVYAPGWCG
jgi:hypothetical protein